MVNEGPSLRLTEGLKREKFEVFKCLVAGGADVYRTNNGGETVLHMAVHDQHFELVKFLILKRVDVSHADMRGQTPLMLAYKYGNVDIVRLLDRHGAKGEMKVCLFNAVSSGNVAMVEYLYGQRAEHKCLHKGSRNLLHIAIPSQNVEVVKFLVEKGVKVNHPDMYGDTPLQLACLYENCDIVKLLAKRGANCRDPVGLSAAVIGGNLQIVKWLVEGGADVKHVYENGETVLNMAVREHHFELVKFLLEKGVDVNHVNVNGETPLMLARNNQNPGIVKLLEGQGENSLDCVNNSETVERNKRGIQCLYGEGADDEYTYKRGKTLFHAISNNNVDLVEYLVKEKGENINDLVCDSTVLTLHTFGVTPLRLACLNGNVNIVRLLVEQGANLKRERFFEAATRGRFRVVKYLLGRLEITLT
eukprot:GHVR01019171.1.p1 GENE.GHVR01019171.1~~GHVR01019171.1.p1  ORF type:complete len:418 (+),score=38.73 GHVR01019171.1:124-1377(+)